ncbi:MAG TPA: NADH-quinone oxidoreductase subunit C [Chloroflexia bacterium]|nr:NADH-quinone oxidoreductase subunit C [Chloroflexia bacterium]
MQPTIYNVVERVREDFDSAIINTSSFRNQVTIQVKKEYWISLGQFLKNDSLCSFDKCIDLEVVEREHVFEVTCFLFSSSKNQRLRIKTFTEGTLSSLASIWPSVASSELYYSRLPGLHFESESTTLVPLDAATYGQGGYAFA